MRNRGGSQGHRLRSDWSVNILQEYKADKRKKQLSCRTIHSTVKAILSSYYKLNTNYQNLLFQQKWVDNNHLN